MYFWWVGADAGTTRQRGGEVSTYWGGSGGPHWVVSFVSLHVGWVRGRAGGWMGGWLAGWHQSSPFQIENRIPLRMEMDPFRMVEVVAILKYDCISGNVVLFLFLYLYLSLYQYGYIYIYIYLESIPSPGI